MEFIARFHPIVVHFPIALFIVYSLLEVLSLYFKEKNYERIIMIILGIGLLFAVWGVMTGDKALEIAQHHLTQQQLEIASAHESFATTSLFYYAALFFIKFFLLVKKKFEGIVKYVYLAMVIIGIIFIYLTGYYGGQLVFDYGVGTKLFN
jgi:uncharacterized membrane protein